MIAETEAGDGSAVALISQPCFRGGTLNLDSYARGERPLAQNLSPLRGRKSSIGLKDA